MSSLVLRNGYKIGYKEWGVGNSKKILALHGWLDNANSFSFLGPHLSSSYHVVAIDFLGHGLSSHLPFGAQYTHHVQFPVLREVTKTLGWRNYSVIGHSMGAAIGSVFTAVCPDNIASLVMIDDVGPLCRPASKTVSIMRSYMEYDLKQSMLIPKEPKQYNTVGDAIKVRSENVSSYPGNQYLSLEASSYLIKRGCRLINDPNSERELDDINDGPVTFRHDKRLLSPSFSYLNIDQVVDIMNHISVPTLLVYGIDGWPLGSESDIAAKKKPLIVKQLWTEKMLPGSHHLHLDPDHCLATAQEITSFLDKSYSNL